MTYKDGVKSFQRIYSDLYEKGVDYWTAHEYWHEFIDALCKAGEITLKQYETWSTPFEYGKPLSVRKVYSR